MSSVSPNRTLLDAVLRHLVTEEAAVPVLSPGGGGMGGCHCDRLQKLWDVAFAGEDWSARACHLLSLSLDFLDMDLAFMVEIQPAACTVRYACDRTGTLEEEALLSYEAVVRQRLAGLDQPVAVATQAPTGAPLYGVLVPLRHHNRTVGLLVFLNEAGHPLQPGDGQLLVMLAEWFEQCLLEEQALSYLNALAMTDNLTGLPNRRAAELRLQRAQERAAETGRGFSLCMCDIDNFKLINDFYGHDTGDEVLQALAHLFRDRLREPDWIARWGGEEFLIFLHDPGPVYAQATLEQLRAALHEGGFTTRLGSIGVTASFGVSTFCPGQGDSWQTLLEADSCLYSAKKRGRDLVVISGLGTDCGLGQAGLLSQALEHDGLRAAWQPVVDLRRQEPVGEEGYARILLEGRAFSAGEFLAPAEGGHLLGMLDHAMAGLAVSHLLGCCARLDPGWRIFLNVSPLFLLRQDLMQQFYARVLLLRQMLERPVPLVLDLAAQRGAEQAEKLARQLAPLCAMGVELALDRFGDGGASHLYLSRLPIRYLKLDQWFVTGALTASRVQTQARRLVAMARDLGVITIAGRLETADQVAMARDLGIDWGQGYYFAAPVLEY